MQAALCENFIVKMDWSLRSRSASPARDENAASVTSNIAAQESVLVNEIERSFTNVERNIQNAVELFNIINVTIGCNESPVAANELHSMLATFKTAMQAQNTKLATELESKLTFRHHASYI